MKITALLDVLNSALAEPFALAWSQDSPRFLLVLTVVYAVAVIVTVTDQKNTRPGAEHGSAAWGDVFRLNKFYMDKRRPNLLLTQHFHIGLDGYKHKHNTNILIVGGSGAGKTRTYGVPNVLECACSMVITDPKSEILRKTGNLLKRKGYEVIVFDLINPAASFCYNPFVYVHDDREVLTLIENLIQNTTPSHSKSSDPFWEKSETALLQALMLYLLHEAPPEEQNFSMVMEMIAAAEVHEDDDNYQSPLDILFERLEMREPDSIACKQYRIFKQAAGKTAKSILVSVGVRLAAFNLPSIQMWSTHEGQQKIETHGDKLMNYIRFWQAAGESEKTSIRTRDRIRQIVSSGHYTGGFVCYGYKLEDQGRRNKRDKPVMDLVINEEEATWVRELFYKVIQEGASGYALAEMLNNRGLRTRAGAKFQSSNIIRIIRHEGYTGYIITKNFLLLVFEGTAVCAPLGTRMAWFEGKNKKEKAEKHPVESFSAFCYFS